MMKKTIGRINLNRTVFISNSQYKEEKTTLDWMKESLIKKNLKKIILSVSYIKTSGLNLLSKEIEQFVSKGGQIEIITCLDFGFTDSKALEFFQQLYENNQTSVKMQIIERPSNRNFHPKIYLFSTTNSRWAIIGSANFSRGGLKDNFEAGILTYDEEVLTDINDYLLQISKKARPLTRECLTKYIEKEKKRRQYLEEIKSFMRGKKNIPVEFINIQKNIEEVFKISEVVKSTINASTRFFLVNTDRAHSKPRLADEEDMIRHRKAAAYSGRKHEITKLSRGDHIFLYASGEGIIAIGIGSGRLEKKSHHDSPEAVYEEYFMELDDFQSLNDHLSAERIRKEILLLDEDPPSYRGTVVQIRNASSLGKRIWEYIHENCLG